jgi:hypothetical protein
VEVCRNVEFNQFRHHVLLAGPACRSAAFFRSHRKNLNLYKPMSSLFPRYLACSGKLNAINRNTRAKEELFACALERLKFD